MQEAAVVLSILRERGRKGLPLTQLDRQMFNKDLYLLFVDRTSGRHAGVVDVLAGRWPVELTRLFRGRTRGAVGWIRRAGHCLDPVAAVGPGR